MYKELEETEQFEKEIEQNLEYIEAQQQDLETALDGYAQQLEQLILQENNNLSSKPRCFILIKINTS
jgi:LPS O-antigen subunit length determinant protein (WzzB/FepE family)